MKALQVIGIAAMIFPFALMAWLLGGWPMVFGMFACMGLSFVAFVALLLSGSGDQP